MGAKDTIVEIKKQFAEIERVKAILAKELQTISDDDTRSGNYKNAQRMAAKDKARQELKMILDRAENITKALDAEAKAVYGSFDYSNPKLSGAVMFITANGPGIPIDAAKQMITDFQGRPAELKYLSSLFDKNGVVEAAVMAQEAANAASMKYGLPQRVADTLYYSITSKEPETPVDFSGLVSELDSFSEGL